jgi:hypothetical protein
MRISWGYKIFIGYSLFVIGILFLVYKASNQNYDLVTENYYEAELKYQEVIDQKANVANLSSPPKIQHTINSVSVQLPQEFAGKAVEGEVYLYRASDASKDIRQNFTTTDGSYTLQMAKELSGMYQVKLSWQSSGKTFYHESTLFF